MASVLTFKPGGYRFIKGPFQYSAGACALEGFGIERVRFREPQPLKDGFASVERHLKGIGRPTQAICGFELRSPEPFTDAGFEAFNRIYVQTLERWGLLAMGDNPVARSNVCPERRKPTGPSVYAFSYTVESTDSHPSFVIAGSGEAQEGTGSYRERTVRFGDMSPDGMREKARYVLGEMERRMGAFDVAWPDVTGVNLYTVFDIHSFVADEIAERGAMQHALSWFFARPPVQGLDYEMDVRAVGREFVI
jgi:hypothetical protein